MRGILSLKHNTASRWNPDVWNAALKSLLKSPDYTKWCVKQSLFTLRKQVYRSIKMSERLAWKNDLSLALPVWLEFLLFFSLQIPYFTLSSVSSFPHSHIPSNFFFFLTTFGIPPCSSSTFLRFCTSPKKLCFTSRALILQPLPLSLSLPSPSLSHSLSLSLPPSLTPSLIPSLLPYL